MPQTCVLGTPITAATNAAVTRSKLEAICGAAACDEIPRVQGVSVGHCQHGEWPTRQLPVDLPRRVELARGMDQFLGAGQYQITQAAPGSEYRDSGVEFDGHANGVLQEAEGPGYSGFFKNREFRTWFSGAQGIVDQAIRQLTVANGTLITWSIAKKPVAYAFSTLLARNDVSRSRVLHVPVG